MSRAVASESPYLALLEAQDMFEGLVPPSDIVVLRHGQFDGNIVTESAPQSGDDLALINSLARESDFTVGLNKLGKAQIEQVAPVLGSLVPGIRVCVSSDYLRAVDTAEIAAPTARIVLNDLLRERDRGDVAGIPKTVLEDRTATLNALSPHQYPFDKADNPVNWWPFNGEPLSAKREWFRTAMPEMASLAPNQPLLISTHGEVTIAARTAKELGNMTNEDLIRGIAPECRGLTVDNGQFDWWTRRNPETGELAERFTHLRSVSVCGRLPFDTGFIQVQDLRAAH